MPSEAGGELNAVLLQIEWTAHSAQRAGVVKPDKSMMIGPIRKGGARHLLVDQREPSIIEIDRLRAPAKLLGRDRRRGLS